MRTDYAVYKRVCRLENIKMTSNRYISIGKIIALITFLIGMLIFGTYYFTTNGELLFLGYGFVVLAGIINLITLIGILVRVQTDKTNRKELLKVSGMILLNIPIMFGCMLISMMVLGNMRITFTNSTQNELTEIKIVGCETERIAQLEPNESKTVWVGITGDCSIFVEYTENGVKRKETVVGYVTSGGGQKMSYKINRKNKDNQVQYIQNSLWNNGFCFYAHLVY
ncbi:hypothetical protein [Zobellia russellii]|uniref:hypothetical protein n=1 Tax=Zobellia russellii TaxID=248907 RepID=UPI001BFF2168|nr:hypothetical protein [Zobellia russellii]MBT9188341.1 hypothetical protein [Zobellia russellii]